MAIVIRNRARTALVVFLGLAAIGPVFADAPRQALGEISRCRVIGDSAERLRCFDHAADRAKDALVPSEEYFGKPAPRPPEVEQVVAMVRDLSRTVRGRAIFILDNGQKWRQLDSDDSNVPEPKAGTTIRVTIDRGLLDSFNLTIDGRAGFFKVRRID